MICATRNMILLNKRLDRESRRDLYIPTQITGVSVYDNRQSSRDGGFHSETEDFKIRIPIQALVQENRSYMPETYYDDLTAEEAQAYWTIHNEDLIIICKVDFPDIHDSVFESNAVTFPLAESMARQIGFQKEVIHVVNYADNTLRGSDRVKHWRIGGA